MIRCLLVCLAILGATTGASAGVLTFDAVTPNNFNPTPLGDGFSNFNANVPGVSGVFPGTFDQGSVFGTAFSPENVLMNNVGGAGVITRTTPFHFYGAYFHADNRPPTADTPVLFAGFDASDTQVFTKSITLAAGGGWQFVSFDWQGIRTFTWDPQGAKDRSAVGVDNFTYNVPEPSSLAVFLPLVVAAAVRRASRRRQVSPRRWS